LAEKRGEVREALGLYQTLKDLEDRAALRSNSKKLKRLVAPDAGLPATSLDKFSTVVQSILQTWHFPNAETRPFRSTSP
jgi:hypothetical protein